MILPSVPPFQLLAYAVSVVLMACAWRYQRVRYYMVACIALDVVRLGLSLIPYGPRPFVGVHFARLLLDGTLLLVPSIMLAYAMALDWIAVAGLVTTTMALVAVTYPNVQGEALARCYVASMASARLVIVATSVSSRSWRSKANAGDYVLLALAATGLVGAFVALTWPAQWLLVNVGNIVANALLCAFVQLVRDSRHVK